MDNILLNAALEGSVRKVRTDWVSIQKELNKRELTSADIDRVYSELCAGIRVTTRGLTLSKVIE